MTAFGHNLFIVYPPGLGGNHLMNLLGLDSRYHSDVDYSRYFNGRLDNAHFTQNIDSRSINSHEFSIDKINIIPMHLASYLWFCNDPESSKPVFQHRKFCLITMPSDKNSLAAKRLTATCPNYRVEYLYEETRTLYSVQYLSKLFNQHDWFILDSELLFSHDFSRLEHNLRQQGLIQEFNSALAKTIHQLWITSIEAQINA